MRSHAIPPEPGTSAARSPTITMAIRAPATMAVSRRSCRVYSVATAAP
jgi:hypothetical protein